MWDINSGIMKTACSDMDVGENNTDEMMADMLNWVIKGSDTEDIDRRVTTALIMQYSRGCVHVSPGFNNTRFGITQAPNSSDSCAGSEDCSDTTIQSMVFDGVEGLLHDLSIFDGDFDQETYVSFRIYDSGQVNQQDLSDTFGVGDACFVSDMANRLMGWTGTTSNCTLA